METTIIESIVTDKESRQYSPGHLTPAATDSDATTKALMLSGDQETCSTDEEIKIQCQYCGQFEVNGEWDGIKREVIRTGKISHGPCPECFEKAMKEIMDM